MDLVVRIDVIPVREDVRGLLCEWRDLELQLKTVARCKLSEQFGSYFSAESGQIVQPFHVTAGKTFRAVMRQTGRAMSGQIEQYMSMASLHPF